MSKQMISKLNSVRVNAFVFGFAFGVIMALEGIRDLQYKKNVRERRKPFSFVISA